jgi:hypothetical protein
MNTALRVSLLAVVVLLAGLSTEAGAQGPVTPADIQRLQDSLHDIDGNLARLREQDPQRAARLRERQDSLRDELVYLKVKSQKEGVSRDELADVRERIEDLRAEVYGEPRRDRDRDRDRERMPPARPEGTGGAYERPPQRPNRPDEVPTGTELDVRLQNALASDMSQVEDRFTTTTLVDLVMGDRVLVPAGSVIRGVVSSVHRASRTERTGRLTLAFDQLTVNGRAYPIRATVTEAIESSGIKGEAGKIGAGAGVGAIIGGILGGFKGALAGILVGGGGTVAATEGNDVRLASGTVLRIRFDSPVTIRR